MHTANEMQEERVSYEVAYFILTCALKFLSVHFYFLVDQFFSVIKSKLETKKKIKLHSLSYKNLVIMKDSPIWSHVPKL